MKIELFKTDYFIKFRINDAEPAVKFDQDFSMEKIDLNKISELGLDFSEDRDFITITKNLGDSEKIMGLGEKAFNIIRNRKKFKMYSHDPESYKRYDDPIYGSIPFYISTGPALYGLLINSASEIDFDFGVSLYDKVKIDVYEMSFEIFIFNGNNIEEIIQKYTKLTGRTFMPPEWSLKHQISRYTYYPEERAIEIINNYRKENIDVSALYLDIGYMDNFKVFTVNKARYDLNDFKKKINEMGIKLITIIDPGIKIEQNYEPFITGLGNYVETQNREIYTSGLWPGECAFPDFFSEKARNYWKKMITKFSKDVDGLWLDMNEPSVFNEYKTIDPEAIHPVNKKHHKYLHNAYCYYEVKATYEALKTEIKSPFILSRSSYPGIQKYCAIWTGDNIPSDDDLQLQMSMVISLSVSGITFCGCDLGGFTNDSSPELLMKYYKTALFFPLYRNHKNIIGNDQEIYKMPSNIKNEIRNTINKRNEFIKYMYSCIYKSSITGIPFIKPLFYFDCKDNDAYYVNDEYIAGDLLYAPQIYGESRNVYLPSGKWVSIETMEEFIGNSYTKSYLKYPVFQRNNSIIIWNNDIYIYGESEFILYNDKEINIKFKNNVFTSDTPLSFKIIFIGIAKNTVKIDNKKTSTESGENFTSIKLNNNKTVILN